MTNFATAIRTADTLIEVGRFLYEARTASRRSAENAEPARNRIGSPALPHEPDAVPDLSDSGRAERVVTGPVTRSD